MKQSLGSVLIVAPHLILPTRNGADITIERVARHLSSHAKCVDLVCYQKLRRYKNAEVQSEVTYSNQFRGKLYSGMRTLLFRSHYFYERFNTEFIRRIVHEQMPKERYGIVLASYLTSVPLLPPPASGQRFFAWTHNDEFKWFEDLENSTRNPLGRMVCRASHQWLRREVPGLASHAVFIHLTENDRAGFEQVAPGHSHIIASAGTDIDPLMNGNEVSKSDKIIISFVGTLQVQMAFDALRHFHDKFEGSLRAAFGNNLVLQVIGSNPAQAVRDLCREGGWQLYENVSDAKLSQMLAQSTFTMLPFAYATGIKLKLIRSLGSGVPFLSTLVARPPSFVAPPGCCFSNDPNDWVGAIRTWCEQPDLLSARKQLLTVAESFSWPVVVSKLADSIRQFAI